MRRAPRLIAVDAGNFATLPCCGIESESHPGRRAKRCWLEQNLQFGVRAKTLLTPDGEPCGYIEYLPGEFAWRGVDAAGYMFIHCIWNHSRQNQRSGWAACMLEDCVEDAKQAGMSGVAVMARKGPWLADPRVFLANGFEPVDTSPPDYELLVRKFDPAAPNPKFKTGWDEKLAKFGAGLTVIRCGQCPYIAKFTSDILETAALEYRTKVRVIELESYQDAQNAPTPYATFALICNGRVIADHPISRTRFRNIMNRLRK